MTGGIHHFAIKVRDLPASERFYRDVLGLTVLRRWPAATGRGDRSVWLAVGDDAGTFLALESVDGPAANQDSQHKDHQNDHQVDHQVDHAALLPGAPPPTIAGHHLVALRIPHHERTIWEARLAAAGVTISHRTDYTIYFSDPEGNRLGLSHYPEPAERP